MYDVITIGDIKLDTFVVVSDASVQCEVKMPDCKLCLDYGAKIEAKDIESQLAGSAPNVAVGLARLGQKTAVVSVMGQDGTFALMQERFAEEGVDTKYVEALKKEKSSYSVVLNFKGERTIITSHIKHAYHLPKKLSASKWMYICELGGGYEKLFKEVKTHVKKHAVHLASNPGTVQIKERRKEFYALIKEMSLLFVNKEEAQILTGTPTTSIPKLISSLWKLGAETVVITDGKQGSYAFDGKTLLYCPIFPGERKEATGAGDSFAAGYIGALLHKKDHSTALKWGSVNAASVVQHIGPQPGLLDTKRIRSQLRANSSYSVKTL